MKRNLKLAAVVASFIALAIVLRTAPALQRVVFEWDWTNPPPDMFYLHATNDPTVPLTNWPVVLVVSGTNSAYTNAVASTNGTLFMLPGAMFFYVTASNFWGESVPSNVINTPTQASQPSGIKIHR